MLIDQLLVVLFVLKPSQLIQQNIRKIIKKMKWLKQKMSKQDFQEAHFVLPNFEPTMQHCWTYIPPRYGLA